MQGEWELVGTGLYRAKVSELNEGLETFGPSVRIWFEIERDISGDEYFKGERVNGMAGLKINVSKDMESKLYRWFKVITILVARGGTLGKTTITYDQALDTLGRGGKVRCGDGWMVHCPAYEDSVPSLQIAQSGSGNLLMHCKAGCSLVDIIGSLKERVGAHPTVPIIAPTSRPTRGATRKIEPVGPVGDPWPWWVDKTGIPQDWWEDNGVTVRGGNIAFGFKDVLGHKVWKIRTPGDPGKYRWGLAGSQHEKPSLWPLPKGDLGDIIITEEETDCATLRYLGFSNAYANIKGAGFDIGNVLVPLRDMGLRSVTVFYDVDNTGIRVADRLTDGLCRLDIPTRLAVLPLPFESLLDGAKDVSDLRHWLGSDPQRARALLGGLLAGMDVANLP